MKVPGDIQAARIGAMAWASSAQFFVAQIVAAMAWHVPYSLTRNYVSDLGATTCLTFGGQPVCSPWHPLMNASFVALGLTMVAGSWLIPRSFESHRGLLVGFWCIGVSGLGTMVVGIFPENVNLIIHQMGAFFPFVVGNIGMMIIGGGLMARQGLSWLNIYSFTSGLVGLVAATLFSLKIFAGVGVGGMERLAIYPLAAWMSVFGVVWLMRRNRNAKAIGRTGKMEL